MTEDRMANVEPCPRCGGLMRVGMYFDNRQSKYVPILMCSSCGYDYYMLLLPFPCLPEEIIERWNKHARNMGEKVSHARKVAIRIANALCDGEFDEYFKENGITDGITEKDIWTYIDSAYDVFPTGSADQIAPIVIEILEKRKWPGLLKK